MKHIGIVGGMAAVALVAGAALAASGSRQAQVASVTGQVESLKSGSETWQPASLNQMLSSGDKIRTGEKSGTSLSFDDGSTLELAAGSEVAIQTLSGDLPAQKTQSIVGIQRGRLTATVTPVPKGSVFEIETPVVTVAVPPAGADPTLTIMMNPDGSVQVGSTDGTITLTSTGPNQMTAALSAGDVALLTINPATGTLQITALAGSFDIIGPDGKPITLAAGDSVSFTGGAATFVPAPGGLDAPAFGALVEPVS